MNRSDPSPVWRGSDKAEAVLDAAHALVEARVLVELLLTGRLEQPVVGVQEEVLQEDTWLQVVAY